VIIHYFVVHVHFVGVLKTEFIKKMHGMESFKKMWNVCKIMNQMDEVPFLRTPACWVPCMKHASEF